MFLFTLQILQDTELQVVVVGAGRADLVAQTKVGIAGMDVAALKLLGISISWIGLRVNFNRKIPDFSWENCCGFLWFPK